MKNFKNILILDARSLALFRIFLGLLTLCYFIQIMGHWEMLFSNRGVLPSAIAPSNWYYWSLFYWIPEVFHLPALIIGIIFSLFFTLGFWHRTSTLLIFFLMISVHHRNPTAIGNALHPALIFCSFFLPLSRGKTPCRVSSWGVLLLISQMSLVYLFAFLFKWRDLLSWSGSGLFSALSYSPYVRPLGEKLLSFPEIFPLLTWLTQFIRLAGAITIWIPSSKIRGILVATFFFVHIVFASTMTLGLFSFLCLAMWCALIPSQWWSFKKNQQLKIEKHENNKWAVILAVLLLVAINLATFFRNGNFGWSGAQALGLFQRWSLFAETTGEHRWMNITFKDSSGKDKQHTLFPKPVSTLYSSEISRRYHDKFVWEMQADRAQAYAAYVCRSLIKKSEHPQSIKMDILATKVENSQLPPYKYHTIYTWNFPCL